MLSVQLRSNWRGWLHRVCTRKRHQMRHLCDLGCLLAKQVLSQLSYTPTAGVTFILKHFRPFQNPFPRILVRTVPKPSQNSRLRGCHQSCTQICSSQIGSWCFEAGFFRSFATVFRILRESCSSDAARATPMAPTSAQYVKIACDLAALLSSSLLP